MQNAKETASNIAASAKAGMDKTKAVVQEKVEKMTAHDPIEKDMATQRKEEKITQAEINKQQTREHNAATTGHGYGHDATGVPGTGGMHMPGHGTGHILGRHETTGTGGTYGHSDMPGHHGTGHTLGGHGFEGDHLNDTQAGLNSGTHASGFGARTGATHGTGHGLGGRVVDGIEKATGIGSGTTGHNTHGTHSSGYGTGGTYGHSAMPGHHGTGHTLGGHGFEGLNSGTHASGFGAGTGGTHGTGQTLGGRVVEGIEKSTGIGGGATGHQTHGTHPSGYGTGGTYN